MPQAFLNPYTSLRYPPNIGPIIHPIEKQILNAPAARSLNYGWFFIPSFSSTAAMISGRVGTKKRDEDAPNRALPIQVLKSSL